ncbi:hypothetical protein [Agromyces bauzanensis]|uniref:Uncharacterized protein n=1 Tax=Agromyces bauzanensis TaxID=1308924 RepID=A0A917PKP5_9MICO|nr:hypothetical protein [Agromyces bauzanensis]GGJ82054.1 hypothetical protein GCM10011372_20610 [Agromyces bauzanensis]
MDPAGFVREKFLQAIGEPAGPALGAGELNLAAAGLAPEPLQRSGARGTNDPP